MTTPTSTLGSLLWDAWEVRKKELFLLINVKLPAVTTYNWVIGDILFDSFNFALLDEMDHL